MNFEKSKIGRDTTPTVNRNDIIVLLWAVFVLAIVLTIIAPWLTIWAIGSKLMANAASLVLLAIVAAVGAST